MADLNKYAHKSKKEEIVDRLNTINSDIASLDGNEKNIESLMTLYSKSYSLLPIHLTMLMG